MRDVLQFQSERSLSENARAGLSQLLKPQPQYRALGAAVQPCRAGLALGAAALLPFSPAMMKRLEFRDLAGVPDRTLRTGRLALRPAAFADLAGFTALKADPRAYAMMLGGVRTAAEAAEELAQDILAWGRHGIGVWAVHQAATDAFVGMVGVVERPDGRGMALRFAFWPEARGYGLAREAGLAALHFGHERVGIPRIVAVAREENLASRMVLTSIGLREEPDQAFQRDGYHMMLFASGAAARGRSLPAWQPYPLTAVA